VILDSRNADQTVSLVACLPDALSETRGDNLLDRDGAH
jgi:hypothetical protein